MITVNLGDEVKDTISGFRGIATGRLIFLTGCIRILVEAKNQKVGEKPTEWWVDEQRCKIIKRASYNLPTEEIRKAPAGPRSTPPARHP